MWTTIEDVFRVVVWVVGLVLCVAPIVMTVMFLNKFGVGLSPREGRYTPKKDRSRLKKLHPEHRLFRVVSPASVPARKRKKEAKASGMPTEADKATAVLSYGDPRCVKSEQFGKLVDEVIFNAPLLSQVVVRVQSPGGFVCEFGNLFAQMKRIRDAGLELIVCIDEVAASGGYLMSLPANKIYAAPFAIVGSVGVIAIVPNVRRALERIGIDAREITAGRFKRTLTPFDKEAEDSEAARHFKQAMETVHREFKAEVLRYRPEVKIDEVETGDHWSAQDSVAKQLGLVDEILTSNEYLFRVHAKEDLVYITEGGSRADRIFEILGASLSDALVRFFPKLVMPIAHV